MKSTFEIPPGKGLCVLIEKVNAGINLSIVSDKTGKPLNRVPLIRARQAIHKALDWYEEQLDKVVAERGFDNYNLQIRKRWSVSIGTAFNNNIQVQLEPWGFAFGEWPNVSMSNTGSVETDSRAKTLSCFQAPLDAVQELDYFRYGKIVRI